ncbi:hypothetical protein [Falsiroseomonas tokyonensis]|uniref:Uncharacterized protein n=1 Tax=Falsiroseomonas tokyonensis TaxID=430521 RepID=A0ABV7BQT9_9PROT|nr:hypothetical protein [Falsiroseomonas tokyonensis]MBU8537387.1 hypothetical protein [Falsiroseomonas tokyonensis]
MTRINRIATAMFAAGALSFAVPALAQDVSYPRVVGTGENASVEYGPAGSRNTLGGGAVVVATGHDGRWRITHTDPSYAQRAPNGLVPVTVGSGENANTAWVPAGVAPTTGLAGSFAGTGG